MLKKLKQSHPAMIKLEKLFRYMNQNNICIDFCSYNTTVTVDGHEFELKDIDNGSSVTSIPYDLEYKLIYDDGLEEEDVSTIIDQITSDGEAPSLQKAINAVHNIIMSNDSRHRTAKLQKLIEYVGDYNFVTSDQGDDMTCSPHDLIRSLAKHGLCKP